jgi:DNA-3-methyladenine glycosylase
MGKPPRAGWKPRDPASIPETQLCSGPARLCQALNIERDLNGIDLTADTRLWIERARARPVPPSLLVNTPRIGVDYAGAWAQEPLRWFIAGNPHVSGRRMKPPGQKTLGR